MNSEAFYVGLVSAVWVVLGTPTLLSPATDTLWVAKGVPHQTKPNFGGGTDTALASNACAELGSVPTKLGASLKELLPHEADSRELELPERTVAAQQLHLSPNVVTPLFGQGDRCAGLRW